MKPDTSGGRSVHSLGLEAMTGAARYRRWLLELIRPHCGQTILEIGSGLGDLASEMSGYARLVVSDVDAHCLSVLRERFDGKPGVEVRRFDILADRLEPPVDTVIAVNVLEHVLQDGPALEALRASLVPGGTIVLFVPGYPALYGRYDRAVGHVRRYTPRSLSRVVQGAGLRVEVLRPVNFLGGVAWWLSVRVGGCSAPRASLVRLYDRLIVPATAWIERRWIPPFGQSIFCVARVP
ncbi:MAG TPA: methyltransferase domain-containing protein [Actinomycetota bacterium]|nr:methyltransferase domain-containing protein [Actinomycetota bacterium]